MVVFDQHMLHSVGTGGFDRNLHLTLRKPFEQFQAQVAEP